MPEEGKAHFHHLFSNNSFPLVIIISWLVFGIAQSDILSWINHNYFVYNTTINAALLPKCNIFYDDQLLVFKGKG